MTLLAVPTFCSANQPNTTHPDRQQKFFRQRKESPAFLLISPGIFDTPPVASNGAVCVVKRAKELYATSTCVRGILYTAH